jgi:hypothetical protein
VEAGELLPQEKLWTQGSLGLTILASLCSALHFGFKAAITSATPRDKLELTAGQFSFIAWCMRLCMVKYRRGMKSIISTIIRSTTIPTTLQPCPDLSTADGINQSLGMSALAVSAGSDLAAIRNLGRSAVQSASEPITRVSSESAEPAYNLTVDVDECYFVRGAEKEIVKEDHSSLRR